MFGLDMMRWWTWPRADADRVSAVSSNPMLAQLGATWPATMTTSGRHLARTWPGVEVGNVKTVQIMRLHCASDIFEDLLLLTDGTVGQVGDVAEQYWCNTVTAAVNLTMFI